MLRRLLWSRARHQLPAPFLLAALSSASSLRTLSVVSLAANIPQGVDRAANVYRPPPTLTNRAVRKGFSVRRHVTKVIYVVTCVTPRKSEGIICS